MPLDKVVSFGAPPPVKSRKTNGVILRSILDSVVFKSSTHSSPLDINSLIITSPSTGSEPTKAIVLTTKKPLTNAANTKTPKTDPCKPVD